MEKVIVVRYGEIFLKGKNRRFFENLLKENIQRSLKDIPHKTIYVQTRYLISDFGDNEGVICEKLGKIFGIHSYSPAFMIKTDIDKIYEIATNLASDFDGTFKVETNRADKTFPYQSIEISRQVGGRILSKKPNLKVDVKKPENIVNIDIRESGKTLIYTKEIKGLGGLPTGCAGKGLLLLSGGIDSPVAGFMMAKRGMKLDGLHFHSYPYTGIAAKEKVIKLAEKISEFSAGMTLNIVSFTEIQEQIHEKCHESYMITLMRRFMMRIAERISKQTQCQAIITGESLGQVASQTIESITSSNSVVTMPVLRPVIGFDKTEIIEISEKIDTFETSILPYEDCCTVFLPKNPLIKPRLDKVLQEESKLDVETLIQNALKNIETIEI